MRYLPDTNIIIFWLKKRYDIGNKITEVGEDNCFISDVTVTELWFGVECSEAAGIHRKKDAVLRGLDNG
jgi:tRNA(fMet)-specific endonuclease VapC